MLRNIVGKIYYENRLKGTCFAVNGEYGFTARHVIYNKIDKKCLESLYCKFENMDKPIEALILYENEEYDFAILKFNEKVNENPTMYKLTQTPIEIGEEWKSRGYPIMHPDGVTIKGEIEETINNSRYELSVKNQRDESDWKGISGAPLVIDGEISGIIVEQEGGGNLKNRIIAVDIISIIKNIQQNRAELLDLLNQGYHPILKKRLESLKAICEEIFYIEKEINGENTINYHILKNSEEAVENLLDYICGILEEYGSSLILYNRSIDTSELDRFKAKRDIIKKRSHIIDLIKNGSHLVHILIWMLLEGSGTPRIGSYMIDISNDISRDVFINDNKVSLIIGNGTLDKEILTSIKTSLDELTYIKENISKKLFISDELVINSLPNNISGNLKPGLFRLIDNGDINMEIEMYILVTFNCLNVFHQELNENEKIYFTKIYVEEYRQQISNLIKEYTWIDNVTIHWTFIPFVDIESFNNKCKEYIV